MRAKWWGERVKLGLKEALKSPSQGGFWKQRVGTQISPSCLTDQGKETQHLDVGAAVQPGPPRARPHDAIAPSEFPELLTAREATSRARRWTEPRAQPVRSAAQRLPGLWKALPAKHCFPLALPSSIPRPFNKRLLALASIQLQAELQ